MPAKWTRLTTEAQFRRLLVDKVFVADGIEFTIYSDGRISGEIDGKPLVGSWLWDAGWFCRTARFDGEDLGLDCEVIEVSGNQMRYTRDKGTGAASVVHIKAPSPR